MTTLKPNKPEAFDGKRDLLVVNGWIYQVEQYFSLVQFTGVNLDDNIRISFASSLMKGNAAKWWYIQVQGGAQPNTWVEFTTALRNEFVPSDSMRRARDKLRALTQRTSVSAYLDEFQNIVIAIPGMTADEMIDRFVSGLKPQTRIEVLKANPQDFSTASKIALNVDNAIYNSFASGSWEGTSLQNSSVPMDIGNVNAGRRNSAELQRKKDRENNACFVCHKKGCRPWKHRDTGRAAARYNNAEAKEIASSDSEQEN